MSTTNNRNADRTDFRYDEHGSVTEILIFDPKTIERNRNAATTASAWDAVRSGVGVSMGGTVTIAHDQNRRPVEVQVRGVDPDVLARVEQLQRRRSNRRGKTDMGKPISNIAGTNVS